MSDPESFTSLMALVDSHLSKTSLQSNLSGDGKSSFSLPIICSVRDSASEAMLPPPNFVMQLPRFEVKNSEITEVLAQQMKNMFLAKEKKIIEEREQKEKQRLAHELNLKTKEEEDYVIDLTSAIIRPGSSQPLMSTQLLSKSSSCESIISKENCIDIDVLEIPEEAVLPICQDISYMLHQKVRKARCSEFGKVLGARLRPVAAPYLMTKFVFPNIVAFDFSTPSPCDINKEKRLHPPPDPYAHMNMVERFMAMTKDEA